MTTPAQATGRRIWVKRIAKTIGYGVLAFFVIASLWFIHAMNNFM